MVTEVSKSMDIDPKQTESAGSDENPGSESEESTEFIVEKVLDHRLKKDNTYQYLLKWKDYSEEENTWEEERNVYATELVDQYWESCGGKPNQKKGTDRQPKIKKQNKTQKATPSSKKANTPDSRKRKREREVEASDQEEDELSEEEYPSQNNNSKKTNNSKNTAPKLQTLRKRKPESADKIDDDISEEYPPPSLTSWEDEVEEVETVEKNTKEHGLLIYLNWKSGHRTVHPSAEANIKCPQKIIRFYETHLRFKSA